MSLCPAHAKSADHIVDALDNDEISVDFKPLYQCIHIYDALECRPELQRSYQQDRKVRKMLVTSLIVRHKQR